MIEGPGHRHGLCCDEKVADELRKADNFQTLKVLAEGELQGVQKYDVKH